MDSLHTYEPECKDPLGEFEALLEEEHRKAMRKEIGCEIMRRDAEVFSKAPKTCPDCGNPMHSHGRTAKVGYLAVCGEISVRLRRMRCVSCGSIVVPASFLIPENNISAPLAERMCFLSRGIPQKGNSS